MNFTPGDISGSQILTDDDHLYATHINELRDHASAAYPVFNLLSYNVPTDGISDASAALNAAIADVNAAGGGEITGPSGISYYFNSPVNLSNNLRLRFNNVIFYSSITTTGGRGILNINNKNNILIEGITFNAGGNVMAITSFGHNNLKIRDCSFTGTTTTPNGGILQFDGASSNGSTVGFFNTTIKDCKFYDIITLNARTFNIRARDGHHCEDLRVLNCEFNNAGGPAISINTQGPAPSPGVLPVPATVGYVRRVLVDGCKAYNLREGNVTGDITSASLVNAGSSAVNTTFDLKVTNNDFYNDITTTGAGGLVWAYGVYGLVITGNTARGAFVPNGSVAQGPFVSLGRVGNPCVGVIIANNRIEGFNAGSDADSTIDMEIANNVMYRCGKPFILGYQVQRHVSIHDNTFHNTIDYDVLQNEGYRFSSAPSPVKCAVYDNLIIDDRSIPAPSGLLATAVAGGALLPSTTYYYVMTALDGVGETVASTQVSVTTTTTNKAVNVNFLRVEGAVQYRLYRSTISGVYSVNSLVGTDYYHLGGPASGRFIQDTGATPTAGSPPAVSTVDTAKMSIGLKLFGHGDFSDVRFTGNRFYLPNSTFTNLLVKEYGDEVEPTQMYNNEFHDFTGITYDKKQSVIVNAPASTSATGSIGQISYDSGYFYVCTSTNTWKRVALTAW